MNVKKPCIRIHPMDPGSGKYLGKSSNTTKTIFVGPAHIKNNHLHDLSLPKETKINHEGMIFGGFPICNYNPDDINIQDPFTEKFLQAKLAITDQQIMNISILDDAQDQLNILRIGIIPELT